MNGRRCGAQGGAVRQRVYCARFSGGRSGHHKVGGWKTEKRAPQHPYPTLLKAPRAPRALLHARCYARISVSDSPVSQASGGWAEADMISPTRAWTREIMLRLRLWRRVHIRTTVVKIGLQKFFITDVFQHKQTNSSLPGPSVLADGCHDAPEKRRTTIAHADAAPSFSEPRSDRCQA